MRIQKYLFNVGRGFGRSFKERNGKLVGIFLERQDQRAVTLSKTHLCCTSLYGAFTLKIRLVANQQLIDTFGSVTINFLQPLFDIIECVLRGGIELKPYHTPT